MSWKKKILAIIVTLCLAGIITLIALIATGQTSYWGWILICLIVAYGINVVFIVYIFYSQNRTDKEKKCWMLINVILPIIGPILFMRFGYYAYHRNKIESLFNVRKELDRIYESKPVSSKNDLFNKLSIYSKKNFKSIPVTGNIEKIKHVEDSYAKSIELIRSAKKVILINFYILSHSEWLKSLSNELVLKARQGVKIFIIYDPFGTKKRISSNLIKKLEDEGINICRFKPKKSFILLSIDNNRSHKKSLIIDDKIAMIGGVNISDEYINYSTKYHYWFDEAFLLSGEIVNELTKSYIQDWNIYSHSKLKSDLINVIKETKVLGPKKKNPLTKMQMYDSNPEKLETRMENFLFLALSNARKRILIYTPYLYLSEAMLSVLIAQANAGVEIKIILPHLPDNKKFIIYVNELQYKKLIDNNIGIYELDGFVHKKSIIVDDLVIIGTCNLDQRAMCLNFETSLFIDDTKFLNQSVKDFNYYLSISQKIESNFKKDITIKNKILVKLLMIIEILL